MAEMKRAIIIMAKVPRAGNVKTRLQPFFTPAQSAEFAACLLRDTIEKVKALPHKLIMAFSPESERSFFDEFSLTETLFHAQSGKDLGEKIFNAFEFAFRQNVDSAVMIGTDSPTFPPEYIEQSFKYLGNSADAVLGKTTDGGFYLIGLRHLKREIFVNVEWSSEKTF